MEETTRPQRRTVGRIVVPGPAWERIFGETLEEAAMGLGDDKPNPEIAKPGHWVDVTCRNHECPEYQSYETSVGEPVYDVLPPSCPCCGHELEAI